MKKCGDFMTKNPVCCLPNDMVFRAAVLMSEGNVGSIPVVESEQNKKLNGILTDRDLALRVVAMGRDPKKTKVVDVMTREVITCLVDDDIQKTMDMMAQQQFRRIPVVDHEFKIVGIISQADIATRLDQPEETAEMVKEISKPTE